MNRVGVLFVHGLHQGSYLPRYGHELEENLRALLASHEVQVRFSRVHYGLVLEERQNNLWALLKGKGRKTVWDRFRSDCFLSLADSVTYLHGSREVYHMVHECVATALNDLAAELYGIGGEDVPACTKLVLVGHSLGSFVLSNFLWDLQAAQSAAQRGDASRLGKVLARTGLAVEALALLDRVALICTFGSNIPLFLSGMDERPCIRGFDRWLNFYDPDDPLGFPLENLWTCDPLAHPDFPLPTTLEDRCIETRGKGWFGRLLGRTPASHNLYWQDPRIAEAVVEAAGLREFLAGPGVRPSALGAGLQDRSALDAALAGEAQQGLAQRRVLQ